MVERFCRASHGLCAGAAAVLTRRAVRTTVGVMRAVVRVKIAVDAIVMIVAAAAAAMDAT